MKSDKDELSRLWLLTSNAMPPVGIYLYFKHRRQYPNKAKSAMISALIGIPVALLAGYLMNTFILR